MVRIIVGTLLLVGRKEIFPLDLKKILEIKDRRKAGKTVSPNGLYFIGPQYPSHFEIPNITNSIV